MLKRFCLTVCSLLTLFSVAAAQGIFYNAREMAFSGAYGAAAYRVDAVNWNPANLGLTLTSGVGIQLPGMGMRVLNSSFSLADYNRYNGAILDQEDKAELLNRIPEQGLQIFANMGTPVFGISIARLAVSARVRGVSDITLSRDIFDLMLNGNELGRTYDFSTSSGGASVLADLSVSYGQAFYVPYLNDFAVGLTVHWLQGFAAVEVVESRGTLTTGFEGIAGDGYIQLRSANGGSGMSFDLGLSGILKNNLVISMALLNIAGQMRWDKEVQVLEYGIQSDSLTVEALINEDADSLISDIQREYTGDPFSSVLPLQLNVGIAYPVADWLLSAQYIQIMQKGTGTNKVPYFAVGAEWRRLKFLPLRFGMGFGGVHKFSASLGFALRLGPLTSNFAFQTINQLLPNRGTGYGFAMDVSIGL